MNKSFTPPPRPLPPIDFNDENEILITVRREKEKHKQSISHTNQEISNDVEERNNRKGRID